MPAAQTAAVTPEEILAEVTEAIAVHLNGIKNTKDAEVWMQGWHAIWDQMVSRSKLLYVSTNHL